MRLKFTFFLVAVLLTFSQFASGQITESKEIKITKSRVFAEPSDNRQRNDYGPSSVTVFSENGGQTYFSTLTYEDILKTPSWNPISGDAPPLLIQNAIANARENLKRIVKDTKDWNVSEVNLTPFVPNQKWFYKIDFECVTQECAANARTNFTVLVKMDGLTVEPVLKNKKTEILIPGIPANVPEN